MKKMSFRDYFLMCLDLGNHRHMSWVLTVFTALSRESYSEVTDHPCPLVPDDDGHWMSRSPDGNEVIRIEGLSRYKSVSPLAPVSVYDELPLQPGDLPNLDKPLVSTYGIAFLNMLAVAEPFGGKIPYINGTFMPSDIERIIEKRLVDDDTPDPAPDAITVTEMHRFNEAVTMACQYANIVVPAASAKTMQTDPAVYARRKELMEQYKDRLDDPVVQTLITDELIKMDREWMKGDIGDGFFYKSKSYDVVRKKLFLTVGSESGFGVQGPMIAESLSEGWDPTNLPYIVNGIRDGSYNRGAQTEKGGEATKFNYRIFQNSRVLDEDCGSLRGLPTVITDSIRASYVDNSVVDNGKIVRLTEENIDKYMNRVVAVRSPAYCLATAPDFCRVCLSHRMAETPEALASYAAEIGSMFMGIAMSAMHGKKLSVARFDIEKQLR